MIKKKIASIREENRKEKEREKAAKERRKGREQLVKNLKKHIDYAELYIYLADLGEQIGVQELPEESVKSREELISILTEKKQQISDEIATLFVEIDEAISRMS